MSPPVLPCCPWRRRSRTEGWTWTRRSPRTPSSTSAPGTIYNLLENAAKFATPGSQLYLGLAVNGEKAYVTVRNLGPTIPAEEIPLLFERFHKSDKSRSEDKDGYGLGLYIVKTILAQHKEQITVTSQDGVTAFTFTMQMAHGAPREVL